MKRSVLVLFLLLVSLTLAPRTAAGPLNTEDVEVTATEQRRPARAGSTVPVRLKVANVGETPGVAYLKIAAEMGDDVVGLTGAGKFCEPVETGLTCELTLRSDRSRPVTVMLRSAEAGTVHVTASTDDGVVLDHPVTITAAKAR